VSRWLVLAVLLIGLSGALAWSLITIGELKADVRQSEQAIIHLNRTIREERARYEQTDSMLAETARQRADATRRAGQLADQLRDLADTDPCLDTRIGPDVVERVRQYRTYPPVSLPGSAQGVD
jgi:septal ring factor EnvC (AmiA/AmiB activator)